MQVSKTALAGVVVIEPDVHRDARGFFLETYHETQYMDAGLEDRFVQDNHSRSSRNVLRGLHLQVHHPQGKLVRVVNGVVWDVAVDIDPLSVTFKKWYGVELSGENYRQLYIPPGYAHGFVVLSEQADLVYKCTAFYAPGDEVGILWNDPELGIDWPVREPILSDRDAANISLARYVEEFHSDLDGG